MGALLKLILGVILMILSVWWVFQGSQWAIQRSGVADVVALLNGGIPIAIFVIGLFVVWLELDEIKIDKEVNSAEKRRRK